MIPFRVEATSEHGRAGILQTDHGPVPTPAFMPVGTQAAVKALHPDEVAASGARMLIANTYHLWLRPGPEIVAAHGGLHEMMRWPHAIATDSGGYQAFSLAERTKVTEDGFEFSSHLDGARCFLSPEESMRIQGLLGSDIAMQLDICPPADASRADLEAAIETTSRWAARCLDARADRQALFGIVQGGTDEGLRRTHADELAALPFDGLALGGFSVGEPPAEMHRVLSEVAPHMDELRPRYLMGVGRPEDLVRAVSVGIDLFDCVLPPRNARTGQAFVRGGRVVLKNSKHRDAMAPLEPGCPCPACSGGFTRAYLRHLFLAGEILAHRLVTSHNLHYYARLLCAARDAVLRGELEAWTRSALRELVGEGDADV